MSRYKALCLLSLLISIARAQPTVGLLQQEASSANGYVLFAPLHSKTTYLLDKCGKQVHSWTSSYKPGQSAYLLPNGNLLRCGNDSNTAFISGGGRIEKMDWEGRLIWSYVISTPTSCLHHDIYPMPNGNVLAIVWEKKTPAEAKAAGRNPELLGKSIWTEKIIEIKPKDKTGGSIVWEWKVWDHLVQENNPALPAYGEVAKNPQLININYKATVEEDWLHFNSVSYNAALDQVIISNRNFCEFFILDHSTSTAQAASHSGGRYKKGGDILYRWGNAAAYNCGTPADQKLFLQHSAHWIDKGLVDAGKIMVFNNGTERPGEVYSSVEIIEPDMNTDGNYNCVPGQAFKPGDSFWKYPGEMPEKFFSKNVSNAQRLPNGNTLICEGANGRFFEINPNKITVWNYVNPVALKGIAAQGSTLIQNPVFRCVFYSPSYSGLKGKKLLAGKAIELNPINSNCVLPAN